MNEESPKDYLVLVSPFELNPFVPEIISGEEAIRLYEKLCFDGPRQIWRWKGQKIEIGKLTMTDYSVLGETVNGVYLNSGRQTSLVRKDLEILRNAFRQRSLQTYAF